MKRRYLIYYLFFTIISLCFLGCSKKYSLPNSSTGTRVSIGKISLQTNFLDYSTVAKSSTLNLSLGKSSKTIYSTGITSSDSVSNWQHVFGGYALLQFTPTNPIGSVINDSVNLNNLQSYSRSISNGTFNISLFTKPNSHLADSFIRFNAIDSSINISKSQSLNFEGLTSDGLITIPVSIVKTGTTPNFTTFYNGTNQVFNFGFKNGYYFLYIKNQCNGTISVIIPNSTILSKNVTVNQHYQYNISTTLKSTLGGIGLVFSAFHFQSLNFDNSYNVSTISSPSISSILNQPGLIGIDGFNNIYVAEHGSNKISIINPNGVGSDYAGSGAYMNESLPSINGPRLNSTFLRPTGIAIDNIGDLFIADQGIDRIRKIDSTGIVSTIAGAGYIYSSSTDYGTDGIGLLATFYNPYGIAIDNNGNILVTDWDRQKIRKIDKNRNVTTLAGTGNPYPLFNDGQGNQATFTQPTGIVVDSIGNIYIADVNVIRKIDNKGFVTTFAGQKTFIGNNDGPRSTALFSHTWGLAIDKMGNLLVTDIGNHNIRKIDLLGNVSTIAGNGLEGNLDGSGLNSSFGLPYGIAIDNLGNIYVSDYEFNTIRKISPSN